MSTESIDFMTLNGAEAVTPDNHVGTLSNFEPGPDTVTFEDIRAELTIHFGEHAVGDETTRLFIGCDAGEFTVDYGPQFQPIETNATKLQLKLAWDQVTERRRRFPEVTLHFDPSGPIVFERDGRLAACTPTHFPWDPPHPDYHEAPQQLRSPTGPCLACDDGGDQP